MKSGQVLRATLSRRAASGWERVVGSWLTIPAEACWSAVWVLTQSGRRSSRIWMGPSTSGLSAREAWASVVSFSRSLGSFAPAAAASRVLRSFSRMSAFWIFSLVAVTDSVISETSELRSEPPASKVSMVARMASSGSACFCWAVENSSASAVTSAGSSVDSMARERMDSIKLRRSSTVRCGVAGSEARALSFCFSKFALSEASISGLGEISAWELLRTRSRVAPVWSV